MTCKILVVDDTRFIRKMLTEILEKMGYEVVGEAENGIQAVEKYGELQPDLVMMDITMPEMDGITAIKEIKIQDEDAQVLICSAMSQSDLISEALKAGALDYVMKPFKPNKVQEIVQKYAKPRQETAAAASDYSEENDAGFPVEPFKLGEAGHAVGVGMKRQEATVDTFGLAVGASYTRLAVEDRVEQLEAAAVGIEAEMSLEPEAEVGLESEAAVGLAADMSLEPEADIVLEDEDNLEAEVEAGLEAEAWDEEKALEIAPDSLYEMLSGDKIFEILGGVETMKNFSSSYMCNWQEEIKGVSCRYMAVATEGENMISIEFADGEDKKHTLAFSLDGFQKLAAWVEDKIGGSYSNIREFNKKAEG